MNVKSKVQAEIEKCVKEFFRLMGLAVDSSNTNNDDAVFTILNEASAYTQKTWLKSTSNKNRFLASLAILFGESELLDITIVNDISENAKKLRLDFKEGIYECMVIKESEPFTPSESGSWGINPVSFRKSE